MTKTNILQSNAFGARANKTLLLSSVAFAAYTLVSYPAFAANECCIAAPGGTITCDGDGNPVTDVNPYANGISYTPDGLTLNVNGAATAINSGTNPGIKLSTASAGTININTASTLAISTAGGFGASGISAQSSGLGTINITSAGSIKTNGTVGRGVFGAITNAASTGAVTINMTGGSIETVGNSSDGIHNSNVGLGASSVTFSGTIVTNGNRSFGIRMTEGNAASIAAREIKMTGGSITTNGGRSGGISANNPGLGSLLLEISGAISTVHGHGVVGFNNSAANNNVIEINFLSGTINAGGVGSGIFSSHRGAGVINITSAGDIFTTGGSAQGINTALYGAGGKINITVSGIVSSLGGNAINTTTLINDLSTITLNAGANVISLNPARSAIFNDDGDSVVTVNTGAMVTGSIQLGDGDDNLTFAGGSFASVTRFDGGDDISTADRFVDTLTFAGSSGALISTNLVNWENIVVGAGSVISFNDNMLTAGKTTLTNGGRLDAGTSFVMNSDLTTMSGGIFDATGGGAGVFSIVGTTNNGGTLTTQDGVGGDQLTIQGNYIGNNGRILIDANLSSDASASDLFIANNNTAGTTTVNVRNVGGAGDYVVNGIKVVQVNGASNGTFLLDGDHLTPDGNQAMVDGAFSYQLAKQGSGDWHLISELSQNAGVPLFQPGTPVFETFPLVLQRLNTAQSYYQRVGSKYSSNGSAEPQVGDGTTSASSTFGSSHKSQRGPIWGKISGQYAHEEPELSTTGTRYNIRSGKVLLGMDLLVHEGASGNLFFGITGQYGFANADVTSVFGNGSVNSKAYGIGFSSTWIAESRFYLDGQAHFNRFDSDLKSDLLGTLVSGNDGFGQSWSLEAGQPIDVADDWMVTPQAQLTYSNIRFDQFIGPSGELVSLKNGDSLIGRGGISIARDTSWKGEDGGINRGHFYGIANVYHQFEDGTEVIVSGTSLFDRKVAWTGEIGLGFNVNWADEQFALFGDLTASTSLKNASDSYAYGGTAGFKMRF